MNAHCEYILQQFRDQHSEFELLRTAVIDILKDIVKRNGLEINTIEARVKAEDSLAGKLELKGEKYRDLSDITDILGARVVTFYNDDVDKVAALIENTFEIDWENSEDKRKRYNNDQFGYMSLHFICRLPKSLYFDEAHPELNKKRFELQIRTALQHVWSTVNHDLGYKSDVDIPPEYSRKLYRLAGLLEIADEEFLSFRNEIENYRRKVLALLNDGKYDDITLSRDSFDRYMETDPFRSIVDQIASVNHAEVQEASNAPYLEVLRYMGLETLGDVERMKNEYHNDAYNLARHQIGNTDIDIISSTIGLSSLCIVYILKHGGGEAGLTRFYDILRGENSRNSGMASRVYQQAQKLNII